MFKLRGKYQPLRVSAAFGENNPLKSCIFSTLGKEWQRGNSYTWPEGGHSCHRAAVPTLLCPSWEPKAAGLSFTELVLNKKKKLKKRVCISTGSACPAISCDQSMETAACLSSLAIKAADLLCPQPGERAATEREREKPANTQAVFSHTPRPPKLQSLKCHLLN